MQSMATKLIHTQLYSHSLRTDMICDYIHHVYTQKSSVVETKSHEFLGLHTHSI